MDLQKVLEDHSLWLSGEGGESADLRSADLRFADLRDANLRSADLRSANLSFADLRDANLRSADLRSANLRFADLRSANLHDADLHDADLDFADLRGANGIRIAQFDPRGYRLVVWWDDKEYRINAGCRDFTKSEAIAHWSSSRYPDRARGDMYCAVIEAMCQDL